jgi:hypothetical protein
MKGTEGEKGAEGGESTEKNYFTTETQRARSLRKRNGRKAYLNFFRNSVLSVSLW